METNTDQLPEDIHKLGQLLGSRIGQTIAHVLDERLTPSLPEFEALLPGQNRLLELLEPLARKRLTEDEFQSEIAARDERLAELETLLEQSRFLARERQQALDASETLAEERLAGLDALRLEKETLEAERAGLRGEIAELRERLEERIAAAERIQADAEKRLAGVDEMEKQARSVAVQVGALEAEKKTLGADLDAARNECESLRTQAHEYAKAMEMAHEKRQAAQLRLAELERAKLAAENQAQTMQKAQERLEKERDAALEEIAGLQARLAQVETDPSQPRTPKAELDDRDADQEPVPRIPPVPAVEAPPATSPTLLLEAEKDLEKLRGQRNIFAAVTALLFLLLFLLLGTSYLREQTLREDLRRQVSELTSALTNDLAQVLAGASSADEQSPDRSHFDARFGSVEERLDLLKESTIRVVRGSDRLLTDMDAVKSLLQDSASFSGEAHGETSSRLLAIMEQLNALERLEGTAPHSVSTITPGVPSLQLDSLSSARASVRAVVPFQSGAIQPGEEMNTALRRIAEQLIRSEAASVVVIGYTDNSPLRGELQDRFGDNMSLSHVRAQAVADVLVGFGINQDAVFAYGLGEAMPVATNDTPENRAKNRRVEIIAW
jgi:flagellar motor protein MotB